MAPSTIPSQLTSPVAATAFASMMRPTCKQALALGRLTVIAGGRFVHNTTFGNTGVPRVALGFQALRGGHIFFRHALQCFIRHRHRRAAILKETFVSSAFSAAQSQP